MIPSIETIVEGVAEGKISTSQAVTWLHMHAEDAARTLRDDFAAAAIPGVMAVVLKAAEFGGKTPSEEEMAGYAYKFADAMLVERDK